jgi:hypothetical protein
MEMQNKNAEGKFRKPLMPELSQPLSDKLGHPEYKHM